MKIEMQTFQTKDRLAEIRVAHQTKFCFEISDSSENKFFKFFLFKKKATINGVLQRRLHLPRFENRELGRFLHWG